MALDRARWAVPGRAPTALGTIVTSSARPKNRRSTFRQSGCGSIAITFAPSLRHARTRLPTWAPMSKPMSPGPRNSL